ncbi:hypothetical protein L596_007820 [Steinernema carpocapsae]|uniref:Uncharacterized protein n=1 Tax=Steinernema carpocapsae TaxID=34508 RepID=A0A4U5PAQ8_STECR|nr:hypothetical protein L596_007820 [Steinernema carpocapsae]
MANEEREQETSGNEQSRERTRLREFCTLECGRISWRALQKRRGDTRGRRVGSRGGGGVGRARREGNYGSSRQQQSVLKQARSASTRRLAQTIVPERKRCSHADHTTDDACSPSPAAVEVVLGSA